MSDSTDHPNPFEETRLKSALERAQQELGDLHRHWEELKVGPLPTPLIGSKSNRESIEAYCEPEWISGWNAFEIFRLQTESYEWAPVIARICVTISDQVDREKSGLNYVFEKLPPSHELLTDFPLGSHHWFRALYSLLTLKGAEGIGNWEGLVSDLYDWLGPFGDLRIKASDVLEKALGLDWPYERFSLPEAKQEPIWSFPKAMAWIATRDYLALARMGVFRKPSNEDEAVASDGVCRYNTEALGWLHTTIAFTKCKCEALENYGLAAHEHCTCISVAWEELVHFAGGLNKSTPELVFNIQEGWLSMTWPDGADEVRFLRRDILERWPAKAENQVKSTSGISSTVLAENECRDWLATQFANDPDKRKSKKDFRDSALSEFSGRLSERGFNLRVWPDLARNDGRDGAGAKKKS